MTSQPQKSLTNLIVNQQISFKCQLCGGARRKSENCTLAKCAVHYLKTKFIWPRSGAWGGGKSLDHQGHKNRSTTVGTINAPWIKYDGSALNSCWDVSVRTRVVDYQLSSFIMARATLLAVLEIMCLLTKALACYECTAILLTVRLCSL